MKHFFQKLMALLREKLSFLLATLHLSENDAYLQVERRNNQGFDLTAIEGATGHPLTSSKAKRKWVPELGGP